MAADRLLRQRRVRPGRRRELLPYLYRRPRPLPADELIADGGRAPPPSSTLDVGSLTVGSPYRYGGCRMSVIAVGADHAGWQLKEDLKAWLTQNGHQVLDFGTHSPESVDYPDYASQVAESVAASKAERGVLICGTGIGKIGR